MSDTAQNPLTAKRVGQYLVDAGVLKRDQLEEALERQKRMSRAGFHVLLGTILEEMGAIDRQSLEAIILRQRLDEGSVSLGSEADWAPYRASTPAEEEASPSNGTTTEPEATAPEAVVDAPETFSDAVVVEESELVADQEAEPFAPEQTEVEAEVAAGYTPEAEPVTPTIESIAEPEVAESEWAQPAEEQQEVTELTQEEPAMAAAETDVVESPAEETAVEPVTAELEPMGEPDTAATSEAVSDDSPSEEEAPIEAATLPATEPEAAEAVSVASGGVEMYGFVFTRRPDGGLSPTEVSAVLSQLRKQVRTLEEQMAEANDSLAHIDSMRRYGEQTIKAADTIADQITAEAEKNAGAIRERAQQEARRIISDAKAQHDGILQEAADKAKRMAAEVRKNVEEQRELNDRFVETVERMLAEESLTETA